MMRNVPLFSPVATAVAQVQTPLGAARVLVLYIVAIVNLSVDVDVDVKFRSRRYGCVMDWLFVYSKNVYGGCCYIYMDNSRAGKHSASGQRNRRRRNVCSAVKLSSEPPLNTPSLTGKAK